MSDKIKTPPEKMLVDVEAANEYLLDETDSDGDTGVYINLHDNERHDLLDTSDEDPTATLRSTSKGSNVDIWATDSNKKKFVPKHKITYRPAVPQPIGFSRQPAQTRLQQRPGASSSHYTNSSNPRASDRVSPYHKRSANRTSASNPPPLSTSAALLPAAPQSLPYSTPAAPILFATPPPPKPKYTSLMLNTLSNALILNSRDSFNIKLNEDEVKNFLLHAKKEYC